MGPKLFITVDLETTGIQPHKHGIIQIGAVATDPKGVIIDTFSMDANPGNVHYDDEAMKINGFTMKRIDNAPLLEYVLKKFMDWVHHIYLAIDPEYPKDEEDKWSANIAVVAHNAPFDVGFLRYAFHEYGLPDILCRRVLDTVTVGFLMRPEHVMPKLQKMGEDLKIPNLKKHDALADALQTAQIFHIYLAQAVRTLNPPGGVRLHDGTIRR